jgi:cell division protein FtsB
MRPVTMLAGVGVVLIILLAPYLRPWLAQRSDIAAERAQVEQLQRQVDQLQAERDRWKDPVYVRTQARERLNFVMPGELGYVVLNDGKQTTTRTDPAKQAALDAGRITGRPWYDVLWQSMQLAGRPAATSGGTTPSTPNGSATGGSATGGSASSGSAAPGPAGTRTSPTPSTSRTP